MASLFLRSFLATLVNFVSVAYFMVAVWCLTQGQFMAAGLFVLDVVLFWIIDVLLWLDILKGIK